MLYLWSIKKNLLSKDFFRKRKRITIQKNFKIKFRTFYVLKDKKKNNKKRDLTIFCVSDTYYAIVSND
ncbi:hypothetical protein LCGC14_0874490 [marine sediment metagenome]|uniref:Uncharacterized protein n=1 Tax=marine sediment metagenome TaxID=412755 RepID=A0A0F9PPC2_9ZZZZ|nr:MAG: hypothetical protein Lokiarch_42570 [Candidatus Lokiarchaeum sp. GC14_75]